MNSKFSKYSSLGFTLVELLAVIIILAIIALIATPIINDVIENAKISAGVSQAELIKDNAARMFVETQVDPSLYDQNLVNGLMNETNIYDYLEMSGQMPEQGEVIVNKTGDVALALYDDGVCYKKTYVEDRVTYEKMEESRDCTLFVVEAVDVGNCDTWHTWKHLDGVLKIDEVTFDKDTKTITEVRGFDHDDPQRDLIIPCELEEVTVEHLGDRMMNYPILKGDIIISSNVLTIGNEVFSVPTVSNIDIFIKSGVTSIGDGMLNYNETIDWDENSKNNIDIFLENKCAEPNPFSDGSTSDTELPYSWIGPYFGPEVYTCAGYFTVTVHSDPNLSCSSESVSMQLSGSCGG